MAHDVFSMVGTSEALAPSGGDRVSTGIQSGDHETIAAALAWSGNYGTFEVQIEHADRDAATAGPATYSAHPSGAWLVSGQSGTATLHVDRAQAKEFVRLRVQSFVGSPSPPIVGASWMRFGPRETFNTGQVAQSRNGVALSPARTGGVFGITESGGSPTVSFVSGTVEFGEGTGLIRIPVLLSEPAETDIHVTWNVSGGTATEGTDFERVTLGQVAIPAGQFRGWLELRALDDPNVESDETVIVTLTAVSDGAELGSFLSKSILITDNDVVANPTAGFTGINPSVVEGSSTAVTVTLSAPALKAVQVWWSVSGTATSGSDFTIADTSPLVIAAGDTSGTITIDTSTDGLQEGAETVVVALDSADGADLAGVLSRTVTILSTDGGGGGGGTEETVVVSYYEPSGMTPGLFAAGDKMLVAAPFAIDPGEAAPVFYHPVTGEKADLIPAAYTRDGDADLHQLVCQHTVNGSNHIEFTTHPVVPKVDPGAQFMDLDLDDWTIHIPTTSGVLFSARLGDGDLKRVWRAGNWVDEREFWVRSTGAGGEKGPSVRFFIDRRADHTIHPTIIIENSLANPLGAYLDGVDPDATGEIFYERAYFTGRPLGYQMFAVDGDLPSQDTANGVIVKPENVLGGSGPEQLWPMGAEYTWHFVLRSGAVSAAKALAISQYHGYGMALSGSYGIHTRRGFGASRYFGMDTTDSRINHGSYGLTGLASTMERERVQLELLQGQRLAGTGNSYPEWVSPRVGMFHPYGVKDTVAEGGAGVDLYSIGAMVPDGYRQSQIRDQHISMRHFSGMVHAVTGDEVTPEDLVAANGNGKSPWLITPRTQAEWEAWNHEKPCFIRPAYLSSPLYNQNGNDGVLPGRALGQDTHPWNSSSTGVDRNALPAAAQDMRISEMAGTWDNGYMHMDGDHRSRRYGCLETLAWGANRGYAKRKLIKEAVQCQHEQNRFELDTAFDAINKNNQHYAPVGNLQSMIDAITVSGLHQSGGTGGASMNRGNGMLSHMAAVGLRLSPPGSTYRTNYGAWLDKFAEALWEICTTYGCSARNDASGWLANGGAGLAQALQKFPGQDAELGPTDLVNRTGAVPHDLTIQNTYPESTTSNPGYHVSLEQAFQPGMLHIGVADNLLAGAIPETLTYTRLKLSIKFFQFMWRYGRNAGQNRPCSHVIVSEGAGGVADMPGVGQGVGASGELQPGAWHFNPGVMTPGPYGGPIMTPDWDSRQLLLLCQSLMVNLEEGNSEDLNETLGWAFEFFGVQTGLIEDLISAAMEDFSIQESDSSSPYLSEYTVVRHGAVAATLEGLRETGAITSSNPSPLVTWAEPTTFNTGVTNAALLTPQAYGRIRGDLVENKVFDWTMEVGFDSAMGVSIPLVFRNCHFKLQDGYGGNAEYWMLYNIQAHSEVAGAGFRKVEFYDCEFEGASSAAILGGSLEVEAYNCKFDKSGGDLVKVQASSHGAKLQACYFGRMGDSFYNKAYNTPGDPGYRNLSVAVHADGIQAEDIADGTQFQVIGCSFDQIGTYHATEAPQPSHAGWPIGAYSASIFVVARTAPIAGTAQLPAVVIEGNWFKGTTIPVRIVYKLVDGVPSQPAPEHWVIARNIWRGEQEYSMLAHYGGTRTIEGNIYEPTGENIDAHLENQTNGVPA